MTLTKVCVVTGTRAEYGLFFPILKKIKASEYLKLQLIATTMHLSNEFGLTYQAIENDGFTINEKIENLVVPDTNSGIAKSTGLATLLLSDTYTRLKPDIVLLLGDRYETLAAATTAMLMNIPIAHIHGGEITEGAVDEQIRHAITKMSYLHFTANLEYSKRVIQLGENPKRVFTTGAPGIDNIMDLTLLSKKELEKALNWNIKHITALFTFHPETLTNIDTKKQIETILHKIKSSGINVLFTYANADKEGRTINQSIEHFAKQNPSKYLVIKSLGQLKYLSSMKYVTLLIGNTSSGIIEAASFGKPVINIGDRQKGRMQSGNVIDCNFQHLDNAIKKASTNSFIAKCSTVSNIYGEGNTAKKITAIIEKQTLQCIKRFHDI